jgi:hypothetical protein
VLSFLNAVGAKTATIAWIRHEAISEKASFESFTGIMTLLYICGTMTPSGVDLASIIWNIAVSLIGEPWMSICSQALIGVTRGEL